MRFYGGSDMADNMIPKADYAVVGGSGTLSSNFPANVKDEDVKIVAENLYFDTPYGKSPAFRHFTVGEKHVLTVRMHGWRSGVTRPLLPLHRRSSPLARRRRPRSPAHGTRL